MQKIIIENYQMKKKNNKTEYWRKSIIIFLRNKKKKWKKKERKKVESLNLGINIFHWFNSICYALDMHY